MQSLLNDWKLMLLIIFFITTGRYLFLAGAAFFICYKPGVKSFEQYIIQSRPPKEKKIKNELLFSLSTISIFSIVGIIVYVFYINELTTLYLDIHEYSWTYFFKSMFPMILIHDVYFYFKHRLLHTKWLLRKVHVVHHRSVNPTPLSAYCFHPVEAILETLIIFPLVTVLTVNLFAFLFFTFLVLLMNVWAILVLNLSRSDFATVKLENYLLPQHITTCIIKK